MQERQKIEKELSALRQDCLRDYLQSRLLPITTREVVRDIVEGFVGFSNQEFLGNILENIMETKAESKLVKKEIQELREQLKLQQISFQQKINQEIHRKASKEQQERQFESEKVKQLTNKLQLLQKQNVQVKRDKDTAISEKIFFKQQIEKQQLAIDKSYQQAFIKTQIIQTQQKIQQQILKTKLQYETQLNQQKQKIIQCEATASQLLNTNSLTRTQNQILKSTSSNMSLELKRLDQQVQKMKRTQQSNSLALQYLKGQNQFLRRQVQNDNAKRNQLQQKLIAAQKNNQKLQSNSQKQDVYLKQMNEICEKHRQQNQNHVSQHQVALAQMKLQSQKMIAEVVEQLKHMKQQLQLYTSLIEVKQNQLKISLDQNIQLKQKINKMNQELNLHFSYNQIHQQELKKCQEQLLKVQAQAREQLEKVKSIFESNWNTTNQQLLEAQFTIQQLKTQLVDVSQKYLQLNSREQHYQIFQQQMSHLQKQLALYSKGRSFKIYGLEHPKDRPHYVYFMLGKLKEQIKSLKQEKQALKEQIIIQSKNYALQLKNTIQSLVLKLANQYLQCSYCKHLQQINNQAPLKVLKGNNFDKTVPRGVASSNNLSSIKKNIKSMQLKYETINQSNRVFNERIESFVKKA